MKTAADLDAYQLNLALSKGAFRPPAPLPYPRIPLRPPHEQFSQQQEMFAAPTTNVPVLPVYMILLYVYILLCFGHTLYIHCSQPSRFAGFVLANICHSYRRPCCVGRHPS